MIMNTRILQKLKKNAGFSLIEIITALVIMAIITVTLMPLFKNNVEMYFHTAAIADAGQGARIAFNRLLMDMRMMTDLNSGTATSIDFNDVDGNTVTYSISGSTLLLNGNTAAENVSSLTFEYIDTNGVITSAPNAGTWQIRVTLQFDIFGSPQSYSAEIQPRNWQGDI
jgi:prepilin-type N-terminal cleavage/methylation domain-containing protein